MFPELAALTKVMPRLSVLLLLCAGCGRLGFESLPADGGDGLDAERADAAIDDAALADASGHDTALADGSAHDAASTDAADVFTITSITPSASITGRAWVTPARIVGTGFHAGLVVSIGGNDCTATTFVSATELDCTGVAPLSIGAVDVVVRSTSTRQTLALGFTSLGQPVLWLRADSIALPDGSPIARWDDGSGFGNHALQATANRQPALRAVAVGGQPAVRFDDADGASDFLNVVDASSMRPAAITMAAVAEMTRTNAYAKILSRTYRSDGTHNPPCQSYSLGISQNLTGTPYADVATAGVISVATNSQNALGTGFGTPIGTYDGTTLSTYYRGMAIGAANNRLTSGPIDYGTMTVDVAIGARSRYLPTETLIGSIAELLVYDHALATVERNALSVYLTARYGL